MISTRHQGFTLIELLIAVVIVGILASIAIPSYQDSVTKTRRAEGKSLLLNAAQEQEKNFTLYNQYATDFTVNTPPSKILIPLASENGYYALSLTAGASATAYRLEAAPQAPHNDPECGTLTLTNSGLKGITGTGSVASCW